MIVLEQSAFTQSANIFSNFIGLHVVQLYKGICFESKQLFCVGENLKSETKRVATNSQ